MLLLSLRYPNGPFNWCLPPAPLPPRFITQQELQRILADKELKEALTAGVELFNTSAVKGAAAAVCWLRTLPSLASAKRMAAWL